MSSAARPLSSVTFAALLLAAAISPSAAEDCGDCADDDRDGAVDCWDSECLGTAACAGHLTDSRDEPAACSDRVRLHRLWASDLGGAYFSYVVGDVDADGMPEVVFIGGDFRRTLRILDGATGALEGEEVVTPNDVQATLADVDADGTGEIFVGRPYEAPGTGTIVRYEHDLTLTYESIVGQQVQNSSLLPADIAFADFDHDGRPEAYNMGRIHDPADGRVLVDLGAELTIRTSSHSFAADFFPPEACALCDGLELAGSSAVWAVDVATGAFERVGQYAGGPRRGTFGVADWNGDGRLDIAANVNTHALDVFSQRGELFVWDPRTGRALSPVLPNAFGYSASVPLLADFDGDLEMELARMEPIDPTWNENALVVRDHDLSVLWQSDWRENSAWTTGVIFDFDSDGHPDIAHRGTGKVTLFSGLDGAVLAEADCTSATATERVVVADLNADGQVDVLSGCLFPESLIAWTVPTGPPSRTVQNQYQSYPVTVEEDLEIPCRQQQHAAPGIPRFLDRSIQQAPLLRAGRTPAEECRCPAPVAIGVLPAVEGCSGGSALLDASGSTGCTSGRLYRWSDETGAVVGDWSAEATLDVELDRTTRYLVTVACAEDLWCHARAQVEVRVAGTTRADAGPDRTACPGETVLLDGGASVAGCPDPEYRWSDASGVLQDYSSEPTFPATPTGDTTYVLDVLCGDDRACASSDEVLVRVQAPPVGPPVGAVLRAREGTEVSVVMDWCRARPLGAAEHPHLYRAERAFGPYALVAPAPHAADFSACAFTDPAAPDALYFYDLRYATCAEEVTASPWRGLP